MINSTDILNNLTRLEALYTGTTDVQLMQFYSKLAMIEFCGWIEDTIDDILEDYLDNHIVENPFRNKIDKIIKSNYGFGYEKNLFKIFCTVVGSNNWENIMDSLPIVESQNFENITNYYSPLRNNVAHTHTSGTTPTYTAPSVILGDFRNLLTAMQSIESRIQAL